MRSFPVIAVLIFFAAIFPFISYAQEEQSWVLQSLNQIIPGQPVGGWVYDFASQTSLGTNGVYVQHGDTTLTADKVTANEQTGDAQADGHVRIEQGDEIWVGEHINYNFKTHQMESEEFRTGKPPVFAQGEFLQGDTTNKIYTAQNAFVTTDDISDPSVRVHASKIRIVPGKYIEMWNAVLTVNGVPMFYFPYYRRDLGLRANNFSFMPGFRSAYGPFLLNTYSWFLGDDADGKFHLDYREKRGVGVGPDLNLHLGQWGEAEFKYYYLHDQNPTASTNATPWINGIPQNRQRFYFSYQATPATNLSVKALVNYQSDPLVLHDFFEGDYTENPQPNSFVEINRVWPNWSVDAETTPRINDFFDQVERMPDVKLTGFRQQVFNTPVYYESESSAGYYRQMFGNTNGPTPLNYSAARADTFHQLLLPKTFFGWLNVTPRAGGRLTYYGEEAGPGGTNNEAYRGVFNTGVETSFKASRLWANATNSFFEIDGLRHIVEPSVNYVFVPRPSVPPSQLPQFDTQLPSLMLLPVQFPDYNDIDSIAAQNVIRFGLRNTLQTKRDGQIANLLDWNVLLDWQLNPNLGQQTFNDLYSDLAFSPRTWLTLDSQTRYDINNGHFNMSFNQLTIQPNETWSWGLGYSYARSGFLGSTGVNYITSTMFFRLNENWGFRTEHDLNAQDGRLQQQFYTIYRDMRSWTAALTFRVIDDGIGPEDFTVAFAFSIKARPRHHLGDDTVEPYKLIGE